MIYNKIQNTKSQNHHISFIHKSSHGVLSWKVTELDEDQPNKEISQFNTCLLTNCSLSSSVNPSSHTSTIRHIIICVNTATHRSPHSYTQSTHESIQDFTGTKPEVQVWAAELDMEGMFLFYERQSKVTVSDVHTEMKYGYSWPPEEDPSCWWTHDVPTRTTVKSNVAVCPKDYETIHVSSELLIASLSVSKHTKTQIHRKFNFMMKRWSLTIINSNMKTSHIFTLLFLTT